MHTHWPGSDGYFIFFGKREDGTNCIRRHFCVRLHRFGVQTGWADLVTPSTIAIVFQDNTTGVVTWEERALNSCRLVRAHSTIFCLKRRRRRDATDLTHKCISHIYIFIDNSGRRAEGWRRRRRARTRVCVYGYVSTLYLDQH